MSARALRSKLNLPPAWPARVAALGLLIGMGVSLKLWMVTNRTLPVCSLVAGSWLQSFTPILFIVAVICAISIIVKSSIRLSGALLLICILAMIGLDLNRFQPWVYEYCLIISFYVIGGRTANFSNSRLKCVSLLILCMYIFSGLQKINWYFITNTGPWLLGMAKLHANSDVFAITNQTSLFASLALILGELLVATLLVFKRTRIAGIALGLIMHLSILASFGPQNLNSNAIIWPWNIFQMTLLTGCFLQLPYYGKWLFKLNLKRDLVASALLLISAFIIPTLGLLQLTDTYPSFALYAGDAPQGMLVFSTLTYRKLPQNVQALCQNYRDTPLWSIDFANWALVETTAPTYPSKFCFLRMAKEFSEEYSRDGLMVVITTFPKLSTSPKEEMVSIVGSRSRKPEIDF